MSSQKNFRFRTWRMIAWIIFILVMLALSAVYRFFFWPFEEEQAEVDPMSVCFEEEIGINPLVIRPENKERMGVYVAPSMCRQLEFDTTTPGQFRITVNESNLSDMIMLVMGYESSVWIEYPPGCRNAATWVFNTTNDVERYIAFQNRSDHSKTVYISVEFSMQLTENEEWYH